jgi:hypothetical protein
MRVITTICSVLLFAGCAPSASKKWLNGTGGPLAPSAEMTRLERAKRDACFQESQPGCIVPGMAPDVSTNGVTTLTCAEFQDAMKLTGEVLLHVPKAPSGFAEKSKSLFQASDLVVAHIAAVWANAIHIDSRLSASFPYGTEQNGFRHSWGSAVARTSEVLKLRDAIDALEKLDAEVIKSATEDGREEAKSLAEASHLLRMMATEPDGSLVSYRAKADEARTAFAKAEVRLKMASPTLPTEK